MTGHGPFDIQYQLRYRYKSAIQYYIIRVVANPAFVVTVVKSQQYNYA